MNIRSIGRGEQGEESEGALVAASAVEDVAHGYGPGDASDQRVALEEADDGAEGLRAKESYGPRQGRCISPNVTAALPVALGSLGLRRSQVGAPEHVDVNSD